MAKTFASPEGIFVFDDTSFPKQGKHSVGVQRQYCGPGQEGQLPGRPVGPLRQPHGPLPRWRMRLFLPESWIEVSERLDEAGVPEAFRRSNDQGRRSPWSCSTRCAARGSARWLVVADAGYGVSEDVPRGVGNAGAELHRRRDTDEMVVFTEEPQWEWPAGPTGAGAGRGRGPGWPRAARDR